MVNDECAPAEMPHLAAGGCTRKTREDRTSKRDEVGIGKVGECEGTSRRPVGLLGEAAGELGEAGGVSAMTQASARVWGAAGSVRR
jgi:hypothetical protein